MIVLDTHVLIWLLGDPEKLSERASAAIERAQHRGEVPAISCLSFYEIARGIIRGRMRVHSPLAAFLEHIDMNFHVVPLTAQIGRLAAELSSGFPGDPFDRVIAATAIANGVPLITADKSILRSREVETIW